MAISELDYLDTSDVALIRRTRSGDMAAYGMLFERHRSSAMALAWRLSRSAADVDDLVAEGSAKVMSALLRGRGPDLAFRPYLLSTIRRLAYDRTDRERREAPVEERDLEPAADLTDPVLDDFERATAAAAFTSLPERWRMVLWHTEVEGQSPAEVALLLGMKPNAVAALAYRAREGLRQAYLTNHAVADSTATHACRWTADRLASYIRGGLTPPHEAQVHDHLEECARCQAAYHELTQVNSSMRGIIGALVLGPAAGGYLASLGVPLAPATTAQVGIGAVARMIGRRGRQRVPGSRVLRARPATVGAAAAAAAVVVGVVVAVAAQGGQDVAAERATDRRRARSATSNVATRTLDASVTTRPVAPATPATPAPPAAVPTPAAPSVGSAAPAIPVADVSDVPGANVTTTTLASSPTTIPATPIPAPTTTPPPAPGRLRVGLSSAGGMVAGRPGVVVVEVDNTGSGEASGVTVVVSLRAMTARPLAPGRTSQARSTPSGWTCDVASTSSIVCRILLVTAGSHASIFLPVSVPSGVDLVGAEVVASGQNITDDPEGQTHDTEMPVEPDGMAARFATIDRGGVSVAGAGLLTCPESDVDCAPARARHGASIDNGSFAMAPIDVDDDPTTSVSARADLDLPEGATVLSAQLYWGGDLTAGAGGAAAPHPDQAGNVRLTGPDGVTTSVAAERVDHVGTRYQGVADVTGLVAGGGRGSWVLADAQLGTGRNRFGGWSLVVAYRSPTAPLRSIVVLDGLREVFTGSSSSFVVGGFLVPATGAGAASAWVQAYDGDAGLIGDQVSVDGHALVDAANPAGDSFNATLSDGGTLHQGAGVFANTFGFDLDRFDLSGALVPGATEARIDLATAADAYLPGVVAIAVDQ